MNIPDFPLVAKAISNLKVQKFAPDLPVLERMMFHAQSIHDFAAAHLAVWLWKGVEPEGDGLNPFQRSAVALSRSVRVSIETAEFCEPDEPMARELRDLLKVQTRLTTSAYGGVSGSSFLETAPSDMARREAVERRNREGGTGGLTKVKVKRERCKPFDARWPSHW